MTTLSSTDPTTTTTTTTLSFAPPTTSTDPPAYLAKLLSNTYAELESVKNQLDVQQKRADNAERLLNAFQTIRGTNGVSSPSSSTATAPPSAGSPSSSSEDRVVQIINDFQQRAEQAERERDEEFARRTAITSAWRQLTDFLDTADYSIKDMRAGFNRIVLEGGGVLTPTTLHPPKNRVSRSFPPPVPFPSLPLPPMPSRRPRTPSLENQGPPAKRHRGEYPTSSPSVTSPPTLYSQPTNRISFVQTEHDRSRRLSSSQYASPAPHPSSRPHHPRRSSTGSTGSLSVDEMLLDAADGSQQTQVSQSQSQSLSVNGYGTTELPRRSRRGGDAVSESAHRMSSQQIAPQPVPRSDLPTQSVFKHTNGALHEHIRPSHPAAAIEARDSANPPYLGNGQREIQVHVFTPIQTGAPQKKPKFTGSSISTLATPSVGGTTSVLPLAVTAASGEAATTPPSGPYPAQNEQGQRICRQCGQPGRYKDGKCVEKWGPGPCGPGTVCDRCRKKMKRVERRGTLELLQQQTLMQNSNSQRQAYGAQPLMFSPATQVQPQSAQTSTALTRTDTLPANHPGFAQPAAAQPHPRVIQPGAVVPAAAPAASPSYQPSQSSISTSQGSVDAEIPTSSVRDKPRDSKTVAARTLHSRSTNSRHSSRSTGSGSRSPVNNTKPRRVSTRHSTDAEDADGEAEADVEAEAEVEAELGKQKINGSGRSADEETGVEVEILEAVEAAEKDSIASSDEEKD